MILKIFKGKDHHILLLIIIVWIMKLTVQIPTLPSSPSSITAYIQETEVIQLDPNSNSFNGDGCVESVSLDVTSPDSPTWLSINRFKLTLTPPQLSDRGTYLVYLNVKETQIGVWIFPAHIRAISIIVTKRSPYINYIIPDYTNLRAGIAYEIIFPQPACIDPIGDTLLYSGFDNNGSSLPPYIGLDLANNRIHGLVPSTNYGTVSVRITWSDSFSQSVSQQFIMIFAKNNDPIQYITDFTPYTIILGESTNYEYILPTGKIFLH